MPMYKASEEKIMTRRGGGFLQGAFSPKTKEKDLKCVSKNTLGQKEGKRLRKKLYFTHERTVSSEEERDGDTSPSLSHLPLMLSFTYFSMEERKKENKQKYSWSFFKKNQCSASPLKQPYLKHH